MAPWRRERDLAGCSGGVGSGAAEEAVAGKARPGLVTRHLIPGVSTAGAEARERYRKNRIAEVNLLGMIKNRIRVLHISSSLFLTSLLLLIL